MKTVYSPINGNLVSHEKINDMVFSEQMLGTTVGLLSDDGNVYAPFDGTVVMTYPSNHAIGLLSDEGVEILVHIGIETVMLNGQHFERMVEANQKIAKGDLLVKFDQAAIKEKGYDTTIAFIVSNTAEFKEVKAVEEKAVTVGEVVLCVEE